MLAAILSTNTSSYGTTVNLVTGSWTAPAALTVAFFGAELGGTAGANNPSGSYAGGGGGGGGQIVGCRLAVTTGEVISLSTASETSGNGASTSILSSIQGTIATIEAGASPISIYFVDGRGGRGGSATWSLTATTALGGNGGAGGGIAASGTGGSSAIGASGTLIGGGGGGGGNVLGGLTGGPGGASGSSSPANPAIPPWGAGGGGQNNGSQRTAAGTVTTTGARFFQIRY